MAPEQSQLPIVDPTNAPCCNLRYVAGGVFLGIGLTLLLGIAFYAGRQSQPSNAIQANFNGIPANRIHPELLSATASHGGANMAVCTAQVDENAEGFFTLDYLTGDLKGWVYYPRQQAFGGLFMTNVIPALGQVTKNPEYLLVSGAAMPVSFGGNTRPAASLIYVVDVRSGYFAAYTIPWNKTMESSANSQMGQFLLVGGSQVREPVGAGVKKPVAPPANGKGAAKPNDPNNPDPNADPNNPAQPPQAAPPANNPNPNNKRPRN